MKFAVIICSRLKSNRLPGKALCEVNGVPILGHLLKRLETLTIPVVLAVPKNEREQFQQFVDSFDTPMKNGRLYLYSGEDDDPMRRIFEASQLFGFEHIVRITHDKVFVDPNDIYRAIDVYMKAKADYLYSSTFTEGTGFEIISRNALKEACAKYSNVEHVSYAIKAVTDNIVKFDSSYKYHSDIRLLVDFPNDLELMETIFACLGNDCAQEQVFEFLNANPWAKGINRLPEATIYTCAYNAEKWIEKAMGSVVEQSGFGKYEYILVDDYSIDKTPYLMSKFASRYSNCKYIRNGKNIGLASSSNVALRNAKGKYIIRLDADDYFTSKTSIKRLISEIEDRQLDAVYPANYFGRRFIVQPGNESHHVGGAIFKTAVLNHIKFTDGLRGYEGLDLYKRAQSQIKIGYIAEPLFFYRQHSESLSKNNLEMRDKEKARIESQSYG